jgi:hypothetical protein
MRNNNTRVSPDQVRNSQPREESLTVQSRGRGWDCVRQMDQYRRRPEVLAAALRDMGVLPDGHDEDQLHEGSEESPDQRDVSLN